jgi:putative ABC transport system permease protein
LIAILSGFFGALAALLAAVGLYGVMAYSVDRRTPEIGIRMALGARQSDAIWMVVGETLLTTAYGLCIGLVLAWAACRAVSTMVFGITPRDPLMFCFSCLLVVIIALLASYVPARRAAKVDPMVALRHE